MIKLGRRPRTHRPEVPHMSALLAGRRLPSPPIERDWTKGMPADFGMMLNDQLGDCTAAAYYHACQVWSFNTGGEIKVTDSEVEALYAETSGYNPADPESDQGAVEQEVLTHLFKNKEIEAFVEVDPRAMDDVKRVINDCGVCYIGLNLPESIVSGSVPEIWKPKPGVLGPDPIAGGHAVVLVGYNVDGFTLISWGKKYRMTNNFLAAYCEEAYAIADADWLRNKGIAPCGLTEQQLLNQMRALRNAV